MSVLFIVFFNFSFWHEIQKIVSPASITGYLLILSIFILLVLIVNWVFTLFTTSRTYKYFYGLIFGLSAICCYYISQYNILIDSEMIRNVIETNTSEAKDLISFGLLLYLLLLALIPTTLVLKTNIDHPSFGRLLIEKIKISLMSFIAITAILYLNYSSLASLARNQPYLSHLIVPTNFIFASISYTSDQIKSTQLPFNDIAQDAEIDDKNLPHRKKVLIMIVGETARADRFSINGYPRDTTPLLNDRELINFNHTSSCGTNTATSLPCLFSHLGRKAYQHKIARNTANLLDFYKHAGIDVQWRDNNTGCKGICDRTDYLDLSKANDPVLCHSEECYDEILLQGLEEQINNNTNDQFIVLHQKGSHGPAYYLRYPPAFEKFKPTCKDTQLQKCSNEALSNSYDNTIVYTDYFINETMKLLESLDTGTEASLVYVSDHGESLGENNLYLHGTPYFMAPESQTHVPFLYWTSASSGDSSLSMSCLKHNNTQPVSHDNLFHSLLGLMHVSTSQYLPQLDIFAKCHIS
ncbi:MAG: phosphoethanolamine--lipid A transferase [Xanthomonadales bacterium]|nr:phosphoethanolamine--lipid A transferase [Xanthomonadales bacterium]